jgi:2-polyprenyl-3-methyl-5-hydroxy-6-metoxy-1,4-benzoquinol methylase
MKWNRNFCREYEKVRVENRYIVIPAIKDILQKSSGKKVIDLGCGSGTYSRLFASKGAIVTAVDRSSNQIHLAAKGDQLKGKISYIQSNIEDLKLNASDFDICLLTFVLIDVPASSRFNKIIKMAHRLLKKNGILIIADVHPHNINRENTVNTVKTKKGKNYFCNSEKVSSVALLENGEKIVFYPDYHYTLEFFLNSLADSGFSLVKFIEPQYKVPYPTHMIIIARKS